MRSATEAELANAASASTSSSRRRRGCRPKIASMPWTPPSALAIGAPAQLAKPALMTGSSGARRPSAARSSSATGPRGREHLGREHVAHGQALAAEALDRRALGGAQHELVLLEQAQRAGVGAEQADGLGHDLAQHRARIEVGGEQRADALQLARGRRCAALGLLELHALDRGGRGHAQALGERDVGIVELARAAPQERHDAGRGACAVVADRHREQRGARHAPALLRRDARIAAEPARGDDAALAQRQQLEPDRRRAGAREAVLELGGEAHARRVGAERLARDARERLAQPVAVARHRELGRELRGRAVDARLRAALVVGGRRLDRERGEPRERLPELDVGRREARVRDVRRDHERAAHAAAEAQRHGELAAHGVERAVHGGVVGLVQLDDGPAAGDRRAGRAHARVDGGAEQRDRVAVHVRHAQPLLLGLVEPDRGGVGVQRARHDLGEALQHAVGVQLGGERLGRAHERGLGGGELAAHAAQAGDAERERAGIDDAVGEQLLVERQRPRRRVGDRAEREAVEDEHLLGPRAVVLGRGGRRVPALGLLAEAHADALDRQAAAQLGGQRGGDRAAVVQRRELARDAADDRVEPARRRRAGARRDAGERAAADRREPVEQLARILVRRPRRRSRRATCPHRARTARRRTARPRRRARRARPRRPRGRRPRRAARARRAPRAASAPRRRSGRAPRRGSRPSRPRRPRGSRGRASGRGRACGSPGSCMRARDRHRERRRDAGRDGAGHDHGDRAPARRSTSAAAVAIEAPATEPASTSSAAPAVVRRVRATRASATARRRQPAAQSRAASAAARRSPSLTMNRSPRLVHRTMRVGRKRRLRAGFRRVWR